MYSVVSYVLKCEAKTWKKEGGDAVAENGVFRVGEKDFSLGL